MTAITSIVRSNTTRAVTLLQRATSLINTERDSVSARLFLQSARDLLNESIQNHLQPAQLYPRAVRIMEAAACIVADYFNQYNQTQVSLPPVQSSSVAASDMAGASALVARSLATHRAITNGNWNNGAIWNTGTVPGEGARAFISAGRNVTYNVKATACVKTVGIHGTLSVVETASTRLLCDTIVVGMMGKLNISPPSQYTCSIEFAGGEISVGWDTRLLSRGLIAMGNVSVVGAQVTPYVMIDNRASAKATQISCNTSVVGWAAGDRIIITPVRINPKWQKQNSGTTSIALQGLNEPGGVTSILTVSAITANQILKLTTSIKNNHTIPAYISGHPNTNGMTRRPYVANADRNIVFRTATSVSIHRRGHVMFMHSEANIRYAKFKHMGRTNKNQTLEDVNNLIQNASLNSVDGGTRAVVSAKSNSKGRYPVHFHRIGVGTTSIPADCYYNYVSGSPGWALAHHDSHVNVINNVVYRAAGAGIVAEVGSEHGKWNNNLVMCMTSPRREILKSIATGSDIFRTGIAYAFMSRNISVVNNIAAGFNTHAFGYLHRGADLADQPSSVLDVKELARYDSSVAPDRINIRNFRKNRAFCGDSFFEVVKGDPFQQHQLRSMITSCLAWEICLGTHLQYTSHYTFKDCEFLGIENYSSAKQRPQYATLTLATIDQVFTSCYFRNFQYGPQFNKRAIGSVATYSTSNRGWRKDGVDSKFLDYQGFFFVDSANTSWAAASVTGNALSQTFRGYRASLQNTGSLSVVYASATKYGNVWISQKDMTNATGRLHRIRGSIRDSLGETNFPLVVPSDGNLETWNSNDVVGQSDILEVQRNILKNFGYFQVSNAATGHTQYVVIRDYFQDRITGSVEYKQYGWKVSGTPVSSWNGIGAASIRRIAKVASITSISVPLWDGRARET